MKNFLSFNNITVSSASQVISGFNRLVSQIIQIVGTLNSKPQLNSIILSNISLTVGKNQINHTLGFPPNGWIIVDLTTASSITRYQTSNNTTLFLNSTAATTVSLQVF